MPRWSRSNFWARTMSATVTTGKCSPYSVPVAGLMQLGPVLPLQPPMTFEQMTK